MKAVVQGDTPFLDAEIPAANGVTTARALAKMYGAIANGGRVDGTQFLSRERVEGLTGEPSYAPDRNIWVPLSFHLGYHSVPIPGVMPGFGHAGLAGSVGWADPESGMSFGFVHNRLLTRMVLDQATFAGLQTLIRRDAARARKRGYETMPALGAPFKKVTRSVAG
jgi:CubicO group peptidase (beta-lactamase class C family)